MSFWTTPRIKAVYSLIWIFLDLCISARQDSLFFRRNLGSWVAFPGIGAIGNLLGHAWGFWNLSVSLWLLCQQKVQGKAEELIIHFFPFCFTSISSDFNLQKRCTSIVLPITFYARLFWCDPKTLSESTGQNACLVKLTADTSECCRLQDTRSMPSRWHMCLICGSILADQT